jgi:hypothetical protein
MKGILLIVGVLALACFPARAAVHISASFGGGSFHYSSGSWGGHSSGFWGGTSGGRYCYNAGCYPYRCGYIGSCGYGWGYGLYGYYGGSYYPSDYYYPANYNPYPQAYIPPYVEPQVPIPPPSYVPPAAPANQGPLLTGFLDVNGFVHSPYSDSVFKVPGVRNAQMVYDPVTGKPFLVY